MRNLGFNVSPQTMRRFWMMLAHYHGQIFNASELARSLDVSSKTVMHYLDILNGTFMIRRLSPWFENIPKRQIKSPKIYFRDTGLLEAMLGISTMDDLYNFPKIGALWEGFALEEVIYSLDATDEDCYFWSTQGVAELDLLVNTYGKKQAFKFKYTDSPKLIRSMHIAMEDLQLSELTIIIPHDTHFQLSPQIHVWGLKQFVTEYARRKLSS